MGRKSILGGYHTMGSSKCIFHADFQGFKPVVGDFGSGSRKQCFFFLFLNWVFSENKYNQVCQLHSVNGGNGATLKL